MRFAYVTAFVDSAEMVLTQVVGPPVTRGRPALVLDASADRGVAALVTLTGDVHGHVAFDVDPGTARRLVERLTEGEDAGDDDLMHDAMAELANMMIGRAVSALHDRGYKFSLSTPMIVTDGQVAVGPREPRGPGPTPPAEPVETLVLTLATGLGDVRLQVRLAER